MRNATRRRGISWQRTAPYLGVACLALLALGSAHSLPAQVARIVRGPAWQLPSTAWLAGPAAPHRLLGASHAFGQYRAGPTGGRPTLPQSLLAARAASARSGLLRASAWPRTVRGALAAPTLLMAVTLARCH